MTNITKGLLTALAVAAVMSTPTVIDAGAMEVPSSAAVQAPMNDTTKFVGTYSLITIEQTDEATGQWTQRPNFNSNGYIIYSDTGQMAVHIQPKVRAKLSSPPTPEEAQAAIRGYTAYFGTYTVSDQEQFVTHHRVGQINPGGVVNAKRYYDFVVTPQGRERLILTPSPMGDGPKEEATIRLIWERQPPAPLSAEAKKFIGFWKLQYTDRYRTKDGEEVFHGERNESRSGTAYIIYTPSGHMMVHLMNKEGRTMYAGAQPTPEEALKAYQSYSGYFGRFITYENQTPQWLIHSQQGHINPSTYSDQQRYYQFTGDVLRLGGPPNPNEAGEMAGGHLYWQKMKAGER